MKKAIDGSIRCRLARLSRAWLWISLALLLALMIYWPFAVNAGLDFHHLDGTGQARSVSFHTRHHELGWLIDRRSVLIWHAHDSIGQALPLLGRYGIFKTLFPPEPSVLEWLDVPHGHWNWIAGWVTFATRDRHNGGAVTVRLYQMSFETIAALLAAWPVWCGLLGAWTLARGRMQVARVRRRRRRRLALGRCRCGYDLRMSRARCPECGRAFRRVPVSLP